MNSLDWWASAKQWARDTWGELMAPLPMDPVENEIEVRRTIHTLLETAEELAGQGELHDVWRLIRVCRGAVREGRERVAADAVQSTMVAYRSRQAGEGV